MNGMSAKSVLERFAGPARAGGGITRARVSRGVTHTRASRGITLFEMVIAMAIMATLVTIAVPSFQYVTTSNRIASEGNALLGDLQFARAEAIKQGQTVSVCVAAPGGASCLAGNTNWNKGWIVFLDTDADGQVDPPPNDKPYRVQARFTGSDTFTAPINVSFISFNREGFAVGLVNNPTVLALHASPMSNASTRCLTLNLVGLMAIQPYGPFAGGNCP